MTELLNTIVAQKSQIEQALWTSVSVIVLALVIAILIAIPLAVSLKNSRAGEIVLQLAGGERLTALLGLLIPLVGMVATSFDCLGRLWHHAVYQNTYSGLRSVTRILKKPRRYLVFRAGADGWNCLALPVILSGFISLCDYRYYTLAALIGAAVGDHIMRGSIKTTMPI